MEEVRISKNSFDVHGFVFFGALVIATTLAAFWLQFGVNFALADFLEEKAFADAGVVKGDTLAHVQADAEGPVVRLGEVQLTRSRYRTIQAAVSEARASVLADVVQPPTRAAAAAMTEPGVGETHEAAQPVRTVSQFEVAIPQEGEFVYADLSDMKLYLFKDGQIMRALTILSKGKKGSRWETPTGFYSIKTKEKNHLSSIGDVYMPYSMQFYGNFFIHGWPYYKGGKDVSPGYSGGCIRLSTEDAKKVYEFVKVKTPLFVHETVVKASGDTSDAGSVGGNGTNVQGAAQAPVVVASTQNTTVLGTLSRAERQPLKRVILPEITAKSFLVADLDTGDVYAEMNPQDKRPIASISKLVTALVVNETISYNKQIPITKAAVATLGESGNLKAGESITATNLLYPLLMESSNDAAVAFSNFVGPRYFNQLMNQKVKGIGMKDTQFEDPAGLSDKNISTADDLFVLGRYLYERQAYLLAITRQKGKTLVSSKFGPRELRNFNVFSSDPAFIGGKTGKTTPAKETMLSLFHEQTPASVYNVAIVVLGSENRAADVAKLREWFRESTGGTLAQIR